MATMQPCRIGGHGHVPEAKETTAHAGWALVSVPGAGAGRCMDAWHSRKCPCHSAELEPSAPPSPPCMHGMATASSVRACRRPGRRRRRHVAHTGRPAGMPFSGDRATARINASSRARRFMWNAPGENSGGIYMFGCTRWARLITVATKFVRERVL